jgi:hypothetical protein
VASLLVYCGLILSLVGLVAMIRPIRRLGIRTRRRAALVSLVGLVLAVIGAELPASEVTSARHVTILDDFLPKYQFHEFHSIRVHAPPETVYAATKQVTAREIKLFRILTWIRSPHFGKAPESILTPPADVPVLDVALRSGFMLLGEAQPREIVFGLVQGRAPFNTRHPTPQEFKHLNRPRYAKIAMNFHVSPEPNGWSTLTTVTRIFATAARAKRLFGRYWRMIYPGSALIRVMWLRAIKARAERP